MQFESYCGTSNAARFSIPSFAEAGDLVSNHKQVVFLWMSSQHYKNPIGPLWQIYAQKLNELAEFGKFL